MSTRDRTVIGVLAALAAVAAVWFLAIAPKRAELSNVEHQVSAAQRQLAAAEQQLSAAQSARTQFASSYASVIRLGEAVPTDDNVGSLIYQLQSAASAAGVEFRGLSLSSQGGGASSGSAGSGPSGSSQAAPPPGTSVGSAGFPTEPLSFTFRGSFFHLADFFARLQRFVSQTAHGIQVRGRLLTLNSINLGPGAGGFPQIDAQVSATAYLLPPSQGLVAGATPMGPTPGASTSTPGAPTSPPSAGQSAASPSAPARPSAPTGSGSAPPIAAVTGGQP